MTREEYNKRLALHLKDVQVEEKFNRDLNELKIEYPAEQFGYIAGSRTSMYFGLKTLEICNPLNKRIAYDTEQWFGFFEHIEYLLCGETYMKTRRRSPFTIENTAGWNPAWGDMRTAYSEYKNSFTGKGFHKESVDLDPDWFDNITVSDGMRTEPFPPPNPEEIDTLSSETNFFKLDRTLSIGFLILFLLASFVGETSTLCSILLLVSAGFGIAALVQYRKGIAEKEKIISYVHKTPHR